MNGAGGNSRPVVFIAGPSSIRSIKSWMGSTHFQMKTLKHVGTEMALHVLAYSMKGIMSTLGVSGLMEAIRA